MTSKELIYFIIGYLFLSYLILSRKNLSRALSSFLFSKSNEPRKRGVNLKNHCLKLDNPSHLIYSDFVINYENLQKLKNNKSLFSELNRQKEAYLQEIFRKNISRELVTRKFQADANFLSTGFNFCCTEDNFKQTQSKTRNKIAIIIPFRSASKNVNLDRELQLSFFLNELIPFLRKQHLIFKIFVINQSNTDAFNRAKLLNIGILQAHQNFPNFDCFLTHDIDRLPVNLNLSYACSDNNQPFHYTSFGGDFGGVGNINFETFSKINGFSNNFYGWGGEDQDIGWRLIEARKIASKRLAYLLNMDSKNKILEKSEIRQLKIKNPFLKIDVDKKLAEISYLHIHKVAQKSDNGSTRFRVENRDVGNFDNQAVKQLFKNFTARLEVDGLSHLKYQVMERRSEGIFERIIVNFHRSWDENSATRTKINFTEFVLSHPCLQSLETWENC